MCVPASIAGENHSLETQSVISRLSLTHSHTLLHTHTCTDRPILSVHNVMRQKSESSCEFMKQDVDERRPCQD